ncbi:MAG TPA: RdgB/HAM1 family non-canonical purine NTP pyrophosphatase [Polyangiales bacterium]|nr:RdgB/HAM1 family non-canonical purine NTP pyrophosphatase [Polyangiales bacterium]
MKLVVATTNSNKVRELRQVLVGFELVGLHELAVDIPEPVEDAATFEGNARIKALAYAQALQLSCVAEDSGLEVDALGGAPGVHSARYAGVDGAREEKDRANNEKLLRELGDTTERAARFVCAICFVADGEVVFEARGSYDGVIVRGGADDPPRGTNGFGYDPLLFIPELGKTSAQLTPDEKNARSHRGQAARKLARFLSGYSP